MHSWPMMVESMSATSSRFQRGSSGWTTMSTPVEAVERPPRGLGIAANSAGPRHRLRRSSGGRPPWDRAREAGRAPGRSACHRAVPLLSASRLPWRRPNLRSSSLPDRPPAASRRWRSPLLSKSTGVIVNADSAQIYRDLQSAERRADWRGAPAGRAPALRRPGRRPALLGGGMGGDGAAQRSPSIHASGRTPILVGGTGLYLRTLLDGIAPVPAIDPEVRARVRDAPVEENRAQARDARSGSRGAAQSGRHAPGSTARWR